MWGGSSKHATIQVPNIQPLCNFICPLHLGQDERNSPNLPAHPPKYPRHQLRAPAVTGVSVPKPGPAGTSLRHILQKKKIKPGTFWLLHFYFFFFQKRDLLTWIMTSDYEEELLSLLNYCHAMSRFPRGGWSHVLRYEGYKHPIPALLCTTRLVLVELILLKCPDWLNKTQFLF